MIEDYDFVKYGEEIIEHVRRHFDTDNLGSVFDEEYFSSPEEVIDFALGLEGVRRYVGKKKILEVVFSHSIGLEGVVAIDDLPGHVNIERQYRDGKNEVNFVREIERKPTNRLVIVMGPLPDMEGHGFLSIYPGSPCPPIENRGFWEKHAFIKDNN